MCLTLKKGERVKIMKEDRMVYKMVDPVTEKLHRYTRIKGRKATPFHRYNNLIYIIGKNNPKVDIVRRNFTHGEGSTLHEGYHSYLRRGNNNAIFVIPEGATYYTGSNGDMVSNKIIFKRWI